MKKTYDVLIVEDHPAIHHTYELAFDYITNQKGLDFKLTFARDCDSAHEAIERAKLSQIFDLVFLDISIPPSKDGKYLSGEDIGIEIKDIFPQTKVIIFTGFSENYRLTNLARNINPDGFLVKSDITFSDLVTAIDTSIFDPPFYSKTVLKLMRKQLANDFVLDNIDRKILYQISKGTKMKDLCHYVPLSTSGIEFRKRKLKTAFNIDHKEDDVLINMAKDKGFI